MSSKRTPSLVVLLVVLGIGFAAGFWLPRDDDFFALRKNFEIFGAVYEELVRGYVDPVDPERLMRTGMEAMLQNLDPYTVFYDEADNVEIDLITRGRYGGVGLELQIRNGRVTVSAPVEDASGYKQGVRAGDIITRIGGTAVDGLSLSDIHNLMRGEPGTAVEVTIEREGEPEPLHFMLTREEVTVRSVSYSGFVAGDTASGIGYVKLERFTRDAGEEVRNAIRSMQQTGPLQGFVLDLRDNPGGLLDAAVEITALFVPEGSPIVSTRGRAPETQRVYRSQTAPLLPDVPLVILVNELSASASEIVAGAVQDLDRGLIVGETTFGKGLVQVVRSLPYNTSLKMTTSRYYTPSGRSIQAIDYSRHDGTFSEVPDSLRRTFQTESGRLVRDGHGIEPDVVVSRGEQSELEQALRRRAAFFFFANHYAARHRVAEGQPVPDLDMDAILEEFQTWLSSENFVYQTSAERSTERLHEALLAMNYAGTDDEIEALQQAIKDEKARDFERHADRLKAALRAEILARYATKADQVEASLAHDPQFQEAVALVRDPAAYSDAFGH